TIYHYPAEDGTRYVERMNSEVHGIEKRYVPYTFNRVKYFHAAVSPPLFHKNLLGPDKPRPC
ncbi:hypothetical protein, partial [uncultured Akkermansia sp.]|uniref:hypothetical protein n=1 Tax=uncultured Akkermansia sp. TaxID=512294 RepID=UPI0026026ABE